MSDDEYEYMQHSEVIDAESEARLAALRKNTRLALKKQLTPLNSSTSNCSNSVSL